MARTLHQRIFCNSKIVAIIQKSIILLCSIFLVSCSINSQDVNVNNYAENECLIKPQNASNSYKLKISEINGYPSCDSLIGESVIVTINDDLLETYPQIYIDIRNNKIDVYYYVCKNYFRMGSLRIVEKKTYDYYLENRMIDGVYPLKILEEGNIYLVADLPFDMAMDQSFFVANPNFDEEDAVSLQEKEEYLEFGMCFVKEKKYLELFKSIELLEK